MLSCGQAASQAEQVKLMSLVCPWAPSHNGTTKSPRSCCHFLLPSHSQGFPWQLSWPRYKKCLVPFFSLQVKCEIFSDSLGGKLWLLHRVQLVGIFLGSVFWIDLPKINQVSSPEFNPSSPWDLQPINSWTLYYYTCLSSIAIENSHDIKDKLQIVFHYTLE